MQRVARRCASSAARKAEASEGSNAGKTTVRDVLAGIRAKREGKGDTASKKNGISMKDFVRARSSQFVADAKQLSAQDLVAENYASRVREAFKGVSTREQLKTAREAGDKSPYTTPPKAAQTRPSSQATDNEADQIGLDDAAEFAVPLQLYPGDLVEYWPEHSARRTGIILRQPDEISGRRYTIIDDRGQINYVNAVRFRFVLHEFYDKAKIPTLEANLFERDEIYVPMRRALTQFKTLVAQVVGDNFKRLDNLYDKLPVSMRTSGDAVSSRDICEIVFGEATHAQLYAVCETLVLDRKHFVPDVISTMSVPMFQVRTPEMIQVIDDVTNWTRVRSRQYGQFIKRAQSVAEYGRSVSATLDGPLTAKDAPIEFTQSDQAFLTFMRQACLERAEKGNSELFTTVLATILKDLGLSSSGTSDRRTAFEYLKLLGIILPWEVNVTRLEAAALPGCHSSGKSDELARYEEATYGRDQVESLDKLGLTDRMDSIRHDFKDLPVYAIDDQRASELDDGLSFDGEWLHVHIADPAAYIPYGSKLADIAEFRGMTFYLPNRVYPMLPWNLVMQHFSLGAKPVQAVMTTSVRFTPSGEICDILVRPAIVRNIKAFTYDSVDEIVFGQTRVKKIGSIYEVNWQDQTETVKTKGRATSVPTEQDKGVLRGMFEALRRFRQHRLTRGALDFRTSERNFSLQPGNLSISSFNTSTPKFFSGRPGIRQALSVSEESQAHMLVEESALAANSSIAKFAAEREIPILYKVYDLLFNEDDWKYVRSKQDSYGRVDFADLGPVAAKILPAELSLTCGPAPFLGLDSYSQGTSPLRRFTDLTVQWQIQSYLLKQPYQVDYKRILQGLARRTIAMKRITRATSNCWTMQLLSQMLERGEKPVFEATVIRNNPSLRLPSSANIESLGQVCQLARNPKDPVLEPGTKVSVVIEAIDLLDNALLVRRNDL